MGGARGAGRTRDGPGRCRPIRARLPRSRLAAALRPEPPSRVLPAAPYGPNLGSAGCEIKLVPSSQGALPEKGRFEPRARPGSAVEAVVRSFTPACLDDCDSAQLFPIGSFSNYGLNLYFEVDTEIHAEDTMLSSLKSSGCISGGIRENTVTIPAASSSSVDDWSSTDSSHGEENAYLWRTSLYLAASASAEFFADIALAPMEAAKVRIQTQPGYANILRDAAPKMYKEEGLKAFYKGVAPLWMRQIPYTMMKFACFERTVEALYKFVVPKPRSECSKAEQLVVTFVAGYIAGVFCAVVSHPADSVVLVLNKEKGSSASQVLQRLGFKGVWKGLFAHIIMIGTLTALQWFIYDSVKVYFRLPRPPPPEMPESLKKKLGLTQ
ncbi:phosphate carrier protein, mitochondrial-like [Canis lupus familiaris]|uniref:phosphate carrier protein, mitochondrial-like n=1 Tax=Canis lupus dingo TaxID=286419 RepID=UPI00022572AE|nr:phosphate carrier protein, mitochondrial-like [Canis lupus dingo]XP_038387990.1 phosphate carrier protein, mitochondrial-like [Canis lupus familiaris]XP_038516323.1 phosphate carrier protein, mitochondrial-like [Canis lupus familiaris]XP_851044.2 phosphate carrier protein, mitochondrial-like [Canis lupus familiaris]|eukprot:XP_851044.2 phosphate carrier protein, mitochondrial-like [Canis lupus familiaris]